MALSLLFCSFYNLSIFKSTVGIYESFHFDEKNWCLKINFDSTGLSWIDLIFFQWFCLDILQEHSFLISIGFFYKIFERLFRWIRCTCSRWQLWRLKSCLTTRSLCSLRGIWSSSSPFSIWRIWYIFHCHIIMLL